MKTKRYFKMKGIRGIWFILKPGKKDRDDSKFFFYYSGLLSANNYNREIKPAIKRFTSSLLTQTQEKNTIKALTSEGLEEIFPLFKDDIQ